MPETRPVDEQTLNATAAAERAFRLDMQNIIRVAHATNKLDPAEWRLDLRAGTFTRIEEKRDAGT